MKNSLLVATLLTTLTSLTTSAAIADDAKPPVVAAAPAQTAPKAAAPRSIVLHIAPLVADTNKPIELVAQIDQPFAEALSARWRPIGSAEWKDAMFDRSSAGGWFAELPASGPPGIEYYIRGKDAAGIEVAHFASEQSPHVVRVVPTMVDRLEVLDREREKDRKNQISLDVVGHNFGNRYDLDDRFVRGELSYTRRLWRQLHSVTFGFGSISGTTPTLSAPVAMGGGDTGKSLRYGFGGVRLRAHESVFVDGRATLGASHEDFGGGVSGAITFGKPWRSCVTVGGEYLADMGPSAWVRLQWDTAPPLLMGASVMRTDLPGADINSAGLYIAYDVAYRVADRFAMKAQLSYGARDGASHWGGGLGSSVDF
jgi:hypothetical protein